MSLPVALEARPMPLTIDPAATAVVVVDMQNHFVSPGGTWANSGVDTRPIQALIPRIRRVLDAARSQQMPVVHVRMGLAPEPASHGMPPQAFQGTGRERWEHYCKMVGAGTPVTSNGNPAGSSATWNADIVAELAPLPGERVITKPRFSGFYETDLEATLRSLGVGVVLFTGCTTSVCVESTLRDASFRGFDCVLLEDCTDEPVGAQLARTNRDATLLVVELTLGWVTNSDAVLQALSAAPASMPSGTIVQRAR